MAGIGQMWEPTRISHTRHERETRGPNDDSRQETAIAVCPITLCQVPGEIWRYVHPGTTWVEPRGRLSAQPFSTSSRRIE